MNCDQAFDALTDNDLRGSHELIQHLDGCPRCRDMADMLDPALDLFTDVLEASGEFEASAPTDNFANEYSDNVESAPTSEHAPSTRPRTASRPWLQTSQRRAASQRDGLRVAAFLMLIAVMVAAMVNVERGGRNDAVAISLPADCQRSATTESSSDNVVAGCVACHLKAESLAALQPTQRTHARQLVQRCVSCHLDMTTGEYLAELSNVAQGQPARAHNLQVAACLFGRGGKPSQL
jgi:cytochrome c553